jgi:hypothetical protein
MAMLKKRNYQKIRHYRCMILSGLKNQYISAQGNALGK